MKLPNCIPQLNRAHKTVRNFLLAPVLLLALWGVKGFFAPTVGLGAAWAAAAQGLPKPEILYQLETDRERTHLILGWNEETELAYAQSYHNGWFSRNVYVDFKEYIVTPEDGIALLFPRDRCWRWGEPSFYLWTDTPGAVRVEGSLRLRSDSVYPAAYYDPDSGETIRWNFFGWDESYALEAEINAHGVCAFFIQMKYGKEEKSEKKQALLFDAEDHALAKFTRVTYASPYDKLNADICLTLYDREGNALRTWEKTLCSLEAETPAADNSAESFDISEELSGQLTEGPLPEGLDFRDRIYISGSSSYYLIDMDGNLVRWGRNWDQYDMGWDENTLQPYSQRNILVPHAKKMAMGYNATLVLDEASVLWGWGSVPWLLLKETPPESNHPEKIMLAVKDIAAGDFYAAAVMEDGTLTVWGRQKGFREPVAIRENVEKVYVLWDTLIFIDDDGNLYGYKDAWSGEMGGLLEEPLLLDTDVEDIQRLNFDLESLLVLKKDGTMGMTDYYAEPYTFLPLAQDVRQINGSGFISSVGDYWQIFIDERTGEYVGMESMKDTAYAVYNAGGESIQIMKNGEILVRLQL